MKTVLSFALMAIVASMIVAPAFADTRLDSLVNLATQARSQIKVQLDKMPGVSDELRALYDQGNQETELLISAVKQGNVEQAKQHFRSAMKIFKQISQTFSEPSSPPVQRITPPQADTSAPQLDPTILTTYKNDIDRTEKHVSMLKGLVAKSNFAVDFSKVDELVRIARSSLAENDIQSVERIFGELKSALAQVQDAIKEQTRAQKDDRARQFINRQISKIDAKLSELEPNLDESIKPKFVAAQELVIQLKGQTPVDEAAKLLKLLDSMVKEIESYVKSKRALANTPVETPKIAETPKPVETPKPTTERAETEERRAAPEAATPAEKPAADSKEERAKQREAVKNQRASAELARSEARLAEIQPHVDDNIKPKFERAESLLSKLKNQEVASSSDHKRTVKMLNLLLDQMEQYIRSLQTSEQDTNPDQEIKEQIRSQESEEKRPSKQNQ